MLLKESGEMEWEESLPGSSGGSEDVNGRMLRVGISPHGIFCVVVAIIIIVVMIIVIINLSCKCFNFCLFVVVWVFFWGGGGGQWLIFDSYSLKGPSKNNDYVTKFSNFLSISIRIYPQVSPMS